MSWLVLPIGSIRVTKKDADSVLGCMFASNTARLNGWEDLARRYQGPGTPRYIKVVEVAITPVRRAMTWERVP
jgi:hypothetical protein